MYCEKCGALIPDASAFCPSCGAKQGNRAPIVSKQEELNRNQFKHLQPTQKAKLTELIRNQIKHVQSTKKIKKAIIIISALIAAIIVGVICLVVYNVSETQKHTPQYLLDHKTWYRSNDGKRHQFLSFFGGGVLFSNDIDNELHEIIGDYSLDNTTLIYKPKSGSVRYYKFKKTNEDNIKKGLYSFANDEWYVSDKYLYFDKQMYTSREYYWDSISSGDSQNTNKSNITQSSKTSEYSQGTQTSSLPKKSSVRPKGAQAANGVVNFDLSKYKDYGSYSCGRVWVKESQWVDRLDGYYDMFAYLDIDGNQISPWLNENEYFTADYVHDFLVLEKVKGSTSDRTHSHIFCIYDLNFNLIEEIECHFLGDVKPFNEYGYSFAVTESFEEVFIDKDGVHKFEKEVSFSDPKKVQTTEKYFLVDGKYVCDHEGKMLVNVEKAVDKYTKNRGYTREKYNLSDDYFIRIDKITNDTSLEITFKAKNKQSKNEVVFKGTLNFNGQFIEGPTKL